MTAVSSSRVSAEVNIYSRGGSISGTGRASFHQLGSTASFSGSMSIDRGSGSYAHVYDARGQQTTSTLTVGASSYPLGSTYDDAGQLQNASFMDFLMPYITEVPDTIEIDHLVTPSPPSKMKSGSESRSWIRSTPASSPSSGATR